MTTTDARKRRHERDMADAHATARARDARPFTTHFTVTANGWVIDNQTGEFSRLNQESDMPEMTDVTSPAQLRHDELKALLSKISEESVSTSNVLADVLDLLRERLPEPTEVKVAPFDPDLAARNLEALKHAVSMVEHGECCEPDLPGEPVEPGDLRAGDRVEFTLMGERIACTLVSSSLGDLLYSDAPLSSGLLPNVVESGEWRDGISDVRLLERAPREDEDRDEAHDDSAFDNAHADDRDAGSPRRQGRGRARRLTPCR